MTRDDIIKLAREAGIHLGSSIFFPAPNGQVEALVAFAHLVAAAEREECIAAVKQHLTAARFDHRHLELGDIRLTMGDQENIEAAIRARGEP